MSFMTEYFMVSWEYLPGYVAYNQNHRAPLNGMIFQGRKSSLNEKMGRRPNQLTIMINSLFNQ